MEYIVIDAGIKNKRREYRPVEMIKLPVFYIFFFWAFIMSGAGLALVSQAGGLVNASVEVSYSAIATLVGLISIFNGVGRVCFGILYDKKGNNFVMQSINNFFVVSSVFYSSRLNGKVLFLL